MTYTNLYYKILLSNYLEDFTMEKDYQKHYETYRKLPKILGIVIAILYFIWSIVDVSVFQSSRRWTTYYGIMYIPNAFLAMLIW